MGKKGKKKGNKEEDGEQPSAQAPKAAPQPSTSGASPAAPPPVQQPPAQRQQQAPPQRQQQAPPQRQEQQPPSSSGGGDKVIVQVPGNKVSLVIGAKGVTIKKLQDDFKVKMWVDQSSREAAETSKPLHIQGNPKNVADAKNRVLEIIGDQRQQGFQQPYRPQGQQQPQQRPPPSWGGSSQTQSQSQPAPAWASQPQAQPATGRGGPPHPQHSQPATARGASPQPQQGPPAAGRGGPQQRPPAAAQQPVQQPFPAQQQPAQQPRPAQQQPAQQPRPVQQQPAPTRSAQPAAQQGRAPPGISPPEPLSAAGSKESFVDRSTLSSPPSSVTSVSKGLANLGLPQGRKASDYDAFRSLIPPKRAARPQDPKRGRPMTVETNHLALSIQDTKATVYHYDVKVDPEKPFRFYRPALREMCRKNYPQNSPSFDGKKNLYSFRKLPFGDSITDTVNVHDTERDQSKEVKVTLTIAAEVSLATIGEYLRNGTTVRPPQDAIQALDVVLRQPAAARFSQVGRSYFSPPRGQIISLGDGMDLWYGFFQSAILGWKPFLNIDVAHKGFPAAENCIKALENFCRGGKLNPRDPVDDFAIRKLRGLVKGLKIIYDVPPHFQQKRTYKVLEIGEMPRDTKFRVQDKGLMNVEQYYMETYNYKIKYPYAPCLKCGSVANPISLPPELCKIMEGQVVLKKLNEEQTRNMVKQAATPADYRRRKILDSMTMVNFNHDPHVREFGLTVGQQFETVDARVLEAPNIEYADNRSVNVRKGVWQSSSFIRPGNLDKWVIYVCERRVRPQDVDTLERELQNVGRTLGMHVSPAEKITQLRDNPRDVENDFSNFHKSKVQLLFVILPDFARNISYAKIKQIAELNIGVLTQCLKSRTISRLSPATVTNILLKVNAKVNGINHYIGRSPGTGWPKFLERPVMVVGADVTHPSPDQQNIPSVAAVAASHDARAFHYNMKWRLQQPREEMIQELQEIMEEQLKMFHERTRLKPEHILFYRDGVSEGQFKKVLEIELQAIRRACKMFENYEPPITFLVVQKRHHTRFFPTNPKDEDGRNKNVPAGTIVDTKITHRNELDFYLVSHASIQGTSRPTKYHVLWDDANMSEQVLEEITYYLCHLFTRCTRAVSYPAPTYYAHLAAFRIRSYIENQQITLNNLVREQTNRTVKPEIMNNCPMFFV